MKIDEIIRTKRKTIAIIVEIDGRVIVRAPLHASEADLVRLVSQKESWIKRKQAQVRRQYPGLPAKRFINGESFYYLGEQYELLIVDRSRPQLLLNERFELSRDVLAHAEEVFTGWYREAARRVISERATLIAGDNNLQFERIRITSARTRWGSCNSRGGLNFAWRLVMAPLPVIDYVVLHELVHTQVKNHSRTFWSKVKSIMPDYRQRYDWLKRNGYLLTLT